MLDLHNSVVYDIETFPNVFSLDMECLNSDVRATWEISHFRDDRQELMQWFNWLNQTQTAMIGFNSINFDYPVIHYIFNNPNCTVEQIYEKAMSIITSNDRFGHLVWADNRFAPQIDLFKMHHFDNKAKTTSLKALQINMRSENVVDMPVEVGTVLTKQQTDELLIPYNISDVKQTKQFAHFSMQAMEFRVSQIQQFGIDVMNWPDTKIGSRMMEDKLGKEVCYDYSTGRRKIRQTPRTSIALNDIIFPYIKFEHPEFNRVLDYLRRQVLTADEINQFTDEAPTIKTKGVFKGLHATVGGIEFHFGTGGIHGSVSSQKIEATDEWLIRDIDVASLYPSIAIVNGLSPQHLGERFAQVYAELPKERKEWQAKKGKKCVEANTLKLASNGVYGNSNNKYSPFYDPQYTMTITVNGQLLLCMLAEKLATVPTLQIIQANTDGITYYIHKDHEPTAVQICKEWEELTALVLEDADYSRMFIRDVNNYIAEDTDGSLKLKGAYWTPDPTDYHNSISAAQPSAWHKDLGNCVSVRAAVAHMVHGIDPELFIRMTTNPYDFMCRIKTKRSDKLFWGGVTKYFYDGKEITKGEYTEFAAMFLSNEDINSDLVDNTNTMYEYCKLYERHVDGLQEVQKTTRYYISINGAELIKTSPPKGQEGAFKKANGVTDAQYQQVMAETGGQWDERVCTKNKSKYVTRRTNSQSGYLTTVCNDVKDFDFNTVNYDWYINEAKKLIIQ